MWAFYAYVGLIETVGMVQMCFYGTILDPLPFQNTSQGLRLIETAQYEF